jgi:hypothetical protein
MRKNLYAPPTIPVLSEYPYFEAIAVDGQDFSSGRTAVKKGQLVILEFGPSQITVHDPKMPSNSENVKLGYILYTYGFYKEELEVQMADALRTGHVVAGKNKTVNPDVNFLILRIDLDKKAKTSVCSACGKKWLTVLSDADQKSHLQWHKDHRG